MHLTEKETIVLKAFLEDCYLAGDIMGTTYSWSILGETSLGNSGPGVFSSLQSKRLINTYDSEGEDYVYLTKAGVDIVKSFV